MANKIKAAVDAGASVINLSIRTVKTGYTSCSGSQSSYNSGTNGKSSLNNLIQTEQAYTYYYNFDYSAVYEAVNYALNNNVVVVAAAGNDPETIGGYILPCESIPYPCYPAQYTGVIAVSGSYQNNNFVDAWNYGSFVSVNAPGATNSSTGILTTTTDNSYSSPSGTSFSAPQVSALAGLLKSLNSSFTPAEIKNIIEQSAEKVGQYTYTNGKNDYLGYGRINAYRALVYSQRNNTFTNQMNMLTNLPITYSDSKYNGAAAVKMMLYYLNKPDKTLAEIYSAGGGNGTDPMNASNMKNALTTYASGYHWDYFSNSSRDAVMTPMIKWISYDYYNYVPPKSTQYIAGYVPLNGVFTDWVAVSGCSLSKDPWNGGNYDDTGMTVNGFWVTRPSDSMGGGDTYYGLSTFYNYFQTINGQYHCVVDPPPYETHPIVGGDPIILNLTNNNILQELSTNLLPKLKQHKKFVEIFESLKFYEETSVTNLETNKNYTIINIGKNKKTEAAFVVENSSGQLLEVNVPPNPVDYILISSDKVLNILSKVKIFTKTDLQSVSSNLVYSNDYCSNMYYPLWEINVNNTKYYVSQTGNLIDIKIKGTTDNKETGSEESGVLQNYPNPFNPVTQIKFKLASQEHVRIEVFDLLGRKIVTLVDEEKQAGSYSVPFNAVNLPSGIYIYHLSAGAKSESKKMILLK